MIFDTLKIHTEIYDTILYYIQVIFYFVTNLENKTHPVYTAVREMILLKRVKGQVDGVAVLW